MATEKDIVLIHFEDKPLAFARIEDISPDAKPNWYHVRLLILQMPLQVVTWILRDGYINGDEFTMNGKRMRLEPVIAPDPPEEPQADAHRQPEPTRKKDGAHVISLADLKKK